MRLQYLLRRAPTIRQWLLMLLAALTLPAAASVVALFLYSYEHERAAIERATLDVSRALMQAIDRELASAQGAMQALATSSHLDDADLRAFYGQATEVLQHRPGNILVLSDVQGRQRVNTHLPFGAPLPLHGNLDNLRAVFKSARPAVSDLYPGPTVGRLLTSVDVPVIRHGRVLYVLSMQYFGERLGAILASQNIPLNTTVAIYDSDARTVWRSRGSRSDVGQRASAALAAALARQPEGMVDETGPDGVAYVTLFSRSTVSNWSVAIALRRGVLRMALWHSLAWIGLGALVLFALGLALVKAIGTRIERSVSGLVRPAIALGYGEPVTLPPLHLREAKDVGHALVQAAALLHERTAQRDEAERARRRLREANRLIERSEAFLRGIFEETPDGVLLVGQDCRVTRANARAEQLFGYMQSELAGMTIDALLYEAGPAAQALCRRLLAAQRGGIEGGTQLYGCRRDASRFPADVMASPLRERGLVILTVRDVSASREQEEALRHTLDDKNILLKELYHRVKNNLQLIISLFNLQSRALPDGPVREVLQEAATRVRAMALVHERLYQSRTLSSIRLDEYVAELCEQLAGAASAAQRGIALEVRVEPVEIGLDTAVPLGLLLNELVSNSLKHAFPEGRRGHVQVSALRVEDALQGELLRLTVRDDGVGMPAGFDGSTARTLGLKLVHALSAQMRARFSIENLAPGDGGGVAASVVFGLPCAAPHSAPDAGILHGASLAD